jgi:hypothetical protein
MNAQEEAKIQKALVRHVLQKVADKPCEDSEASIIVKFHGISDQVHAVISHPKKK